MDKMSTLVAVLAASCLMTACNLDNNSTKKNATVSTPNMCCYFWAMVWGSPHSPPPAFTLSAKMAPPPLIRCQKPPLSKHIPMIRK